MNQEVYDLLYTTMRDLKVEYSKCNIGVKEYIKERKLLFTKYIDYKEEIIEACRVSHVCIGEGFSLGGCSTLTCDSCHEEMYNRIVNRLNTLFLEEEKVC